MIYLMYPYLSIYLSSVFLSVCLSMILPTYPGKIPQTSTNPHKERNSFINCWWNIRGIFQGYVGGILESICLSFCLAISLSLSIGLGFLPSHRDALYSRLLRHSAKEPHGNITKWRLYEETSACTGACRKERIQVPHYYRSNYPPSMRCGSTPEPNELKWKALDWLNLAISCFIGPVIHLVTIGLGTRRSHAQGAVMGMNGCLDSSCARWLANTWLSTARASTSCCS